MCGIFGYAGRRPAVKEIMDGLGRLEYRGYDSAGIALLAPDGTLRIRKAVGKLDGLRSAINGNGHDLAGTLGIGHTRWATHGLPTETNAHPHTDCDSTVSVIHNGIIENYVDLKEELLDLGHAFTSQTDTEVLPHLIEHWLKKRHPLPEAVRRVASRLKGAAAIVVLSRTDPDTLVAVRLGNAGGVVVGKGEGEMWVSSDLPALLPHTRTLAYLSSGEMAVVTPDGAAFYDLEGRPVDKPMETVNYDAVSVAKGPYKHFMLKEIHEQPQVVLAALQGALSLDPPGVSLPGLPFSEEEVRAFRRVVLLGMGTSFHACQVGREMIERLARIPAEVDNASEFRYRDPIIDDHTLLVTITQSGETADTLAAMEEARRKGGRLLTLCNVEGSQATKLAEGVLLLRAGPEIGVAATKTFTASLVALYLLAVKLGTVRGTLSQEGLAGAVRALSALPNQIGSVLADQAKLQELARRFYERTDFLYLGRGISFPIAMEGALKLKEISYIHAEGLPAGEMKHGPIALIDSKMPVVALVPQDHLFEKTLSNLSEVKARGGTVIGVGTGWTSALEGKADHFIQVPTTTPLLQPAIEVVPLQLLAYYIAQERGCDVDQPRNLAKSVTVE